MLLERINSPKDLKDLSMEELDQLGSEIRQYIIEIISSRGGHLASSLGCVEITLALHYTFDAPKDKILWDVGHQSYTHKIITGRRVQGHKDQIGYQRISKYLRERIRHVRRRARQHRDLRRAWPFSRTGYKGR